MATTLYSATMSLDGLIAGPGGDMSWLLEHLGPNPAGDEVRIRTASILAGARTFHGDDPNRGTPQEGPFGGNWSGPMFVLTHRPPAEPVPGVTFVSDLAEGLAAAREAAGEGCVTLLGAEVARQCLEAGEVDEIMVAVAPVLLGDGTPMFRPTAGPRARLEPLQISHTPKVTNCWYRVVR
jgi:dihydrofolate reductase